MKKIIAVFVPHQGCSHRCIFCHQPHITGVLQTHVAPQDIRRTIERTLAEPKSRRKGVEFEVAFYGGTFTGLELSVQEEFLQTAQAYVDCGDIAGIRLSTHPHMFNERVLALLDNFSISMIELGAQSFNNEVLRLAERGHTAEEVQSIVRRLQRQGIQVGLHLMIGLPGDSHDTSLLSAQKAVELRPACVRIHPTLVIQGTRLESWFRQGEYRPLTLDVAVKTCREMLKLFRQAQIQVIRIGLQPTESMEAHIVAGPFHPAFRQLVESAILYDEMEALYRLDSAPERPVLFLVNPKDLSTALGQKRSNLIKLQERLHVQDVRIVGDKTLQRGEIRRG